MSGTRLPRDEDWIHQAHVDLEGLWETAVFRLHEAYDVSVRPGWRLDLPTQPWGEIWLIRSGVCTLRLGDEAALAGPGELAILRPGRSRVSANESTEPLSLVGFGFSIMLSEMIDLLTQLDLPLVLRDPDDDLCSLVRGTVAASHGGRAERVFRARALAQLTLAEIAAATGTDLPERVPSAAVGRGAQVAVRPEIQAALEFVAEHFREPLDLTTVARSRPDRRRDARTGNHDRGDLNACRARDDQQARIAGLTDRMDARQDRPRSRTRAAVSHRTPRRVPWQSLHHP